MISCVEACLGTKVLGFVLPGLVQAFHRWVSRSSYCGAIGAGSGGTQGALLSLHVLSVSPTAIVECVMNKYVQFGRIHRSSYDALF